MCFCVGNLCVNVYICMHVCMSECVRASVYKITYVIEVMTACVFGRYDRSRLLRKRGDKSMDQ